MSLTREDAERVLVQRAGPLMTAAGMDTDADGATVPLNDPIGHALRDLGYSVASITDVTDADVAQVTDAKTDEFLDYATLHTLEAILGNLDDVTIKVGPLSEALSDLAKQVERKIMRLLASLDRLYGYGGSVISGGYIQRDIAEHE